MKVSQYKKSVGENKYGNGFGKGISMIKPGGEEDFCKRKETKAEDKDGKIPSKRSDKPIHTPYINFPQSSIDSCNLLILSLEIYGPVLFWGIAPVV